MVLLHAIIYIRIIIISWCIVFVNFSTLLVWWPFYQTFTCFQAQLETKSAKSIKKLNVNAMYYILTSICNTLVTFIGSTSLIYVAWNRVFSVYYIPNVQHTSHISYLSSSESSSADWNKRLNHNTSQLASSPPNSASSGPPYPPQTVSLVPVTTSESSRPYPP